MKFLRSFYRIVFAIFIFSCHNTGVNNLEIQSKINDQLKQLNSLLRDSAFAVDIAKKQDAAYATSQKQEPVPFPSSDSMQEKSFKEEKIATNLAGFYATECGINALMELKGETPVYWLNKIVNNKIDSTDKLLLNRFANATWKAGQPFRSLSRIKKNNFIVANFLSETEVEKDWTQLRAAASMLLDSLKTINPGSADSQLKKIGGLLHDKQYALQMAMHIEKSYYTAEKKTIPPLVSDTEDTAMIDKSVFEEKIAINIAGFYAMECGISYLAITKNKLPFDIIHSIINDSIAENDKRLLERFANATWKAGQPFRSLDRISRGIFVPFSFLPEDEIEKDWKQIKSAAMKTAAALQL